MNNKISNIGCRFYFIFISFIKVLKPCELFCLKLAIYFEKYAKKNSPPPENFTCRFVYIAPSNDNSLLTLKLTIKVKSNSKEVWSCFVMVRSDHVTLSKDWWKFIHIHPYYTMALMWSHIIAHQQHSLLWSPNWKALSTCICSFQN